MTQCCRMEQGRLQDYLGVNAWAMSGTAQLEWIYQQHLLGHPYLHGYFFPGYGPFPE